jgi:hypothetical protein
MFEEEMLETAEPHLSLRFDHFVIRSFEFVSDFEFRVS